MRPEPLRISRSANTQRTTITTDVLTIAGIPLNRPPAISRRPHERQITSPPLTRSQRQLHPRRSPDDSLIRGRRRHQVIATEARSKRRSHREVRRLSLLSSNIPQRHRSRLDRPTIRHSQRDSRVPHRNSALTSDLHLDRQRLTLLGVTLWLQHGRRVASRFPGHRRSARHSFSRRERSQRHGVRARLVRVDLVRRLYSVRRLAHPGLGVLDMQSRPALVPHKRPLEVVLRTIQSVVLRDAHVDRVALGRSHQYAVARVGQAGPAGVSVVAISLRPGVAHVLLLHAAPVDTDASPGSPVAVALLGTTAVVREPAE